ncbi:MAG: isoaspartyl peptidase/L-asparaginase [Bacteroidota bacterium]|nr:isoaspartyl peptidase/L-asparaginase [Bacteroidota bacterium]
MSIIALAIHGGAGPDSEFIQKNQEEYKKGLQEALDAGYSVLEAGGSAMDAVEAAVNAMEDNALFNAGRGAALNEKAEVEMDASIMDGSKLKPGAVSIVKNVKNPVTLARAIMEKSAHIYLGDQGALEFAKKVGLKVMPEAYFITDHAFEQYQEAIKESTNTIEEAGEYQVKRKTHGTVGAVALDKEGNIAAATSTGGTENKVPGRIGDSSMIGVGSYANNKTCAVSTTGDGELHIKHVSAFHVSALMEYKGLSVKEAARYLIKEKCKSEEGDMGLIAVDRQGTIAMEFNSDRMHRAWRSASGEHGVAIYEA